MKKEDRKIVLDKCNGRCAYCGVVLGKNWHVDHCEPVNRRTKTKPGYYRHKETNEKCEQINLPDRWYKEYEYVSPKKVFDKMLNPENDTIENSFPACHSCNITKSNMNIDGFRSWIEQTIEAMNKARYNNYKFAKRFGLINETPKSVVFYFETLSS